MPLTAPVWMAAPPEVHSALLSSGPGAGPLVAAASAWSSLSAEYTSAATELHAVLAGVQAGAWQGSGAERYVAAHLPYLAWLTQAGANSAAAAAQQEIVAGAYAAALAAMPTLAELGANHATHAALVATNFFGINTVPIALNEADYVRMWIQAASTMATYQAVADTAVAATPQTTAAPQIRQAAADGGHTHGSTIGSPTTEAIEEMLGRLGFQWDPVHGTLNGVGYDAYTNPGQPIYWIVRTLELYQDLEHFGTTLLTNPVGAVEFLVNLELLDWPVHLAEIATWLAQSPQLLAVALGAGLAPVGGVGGLAGLAGLAGLPQPAAIPAVPPVLDGWSAAGTAPAVPTATTPAVPASAVAAAPVAAPAAGAALPPAVGTEAFGFPYLIGPPGIGSGSGLCASAGSVVSAKRKSPAPDSTGTAVATAARRQARSRRQRRGTRHDHGHEFMDMAAVVDPDRGAPGDGQPAATAASDRGAGPLGLAGTAPDATVAAAAGLTALAGDEFGGTPTVPMVPGSWAVRA